MASRSRSRSPMNRLMGPSYATPADEDELRVDSDESMTSSVLLNQQKLERMTRRKEGMHSLKSLSAHSAVFPGKGNPKRTNSELVNKYNTSVKIGSANGVSAFISDPNTDEEVISCSMSDLKHSANDRPVHSPISIPSAYSAKQQVQIPMNPSSGPS